MEVNERDAAGKSGAAGGQFGLAEKDKPVALEAMVQ